MLRAGREDLFAYTTTQILARRGSPPRNPLREEWRQPYTLCGGTRASRPTDGFAANRLLYRSFDRLPTLSFRARVTLLYQLTEQNQTDTMSFRALVEKSPTTETKPNIHDYPNTCPRWLTAEKSPAVETETIVHEYPKYLPAVAHRREIPCGRNGDNHTRKPQTLACGGSPPCPQGLPALPARRVNDFCIFRSRRR